MMKVTWTFTVMGEHTMDAHINLTDDKVMAYVEALNKLGMNPSVEMLDSAPSNV